MAWTSGARSIAELYGEGWFSFEVRNPIGVAAGLATNDASALPNDIDFGLRLSNGQVEVIMNGAVRATGTFNSAVPTECFVGRFAGRIFASLRPIGSTLTTTLSTGVTVPGSAFVHDRAATEISSGPLFLDASLYSQTDTIYALGLTGAQSATGGVAFEAMVATGVSGEISTGGASFLPLSATGLSLNAGSGSAVLGPLEANGMQEGVSVGSAVMGPLTASGFSDSFAPVLVGGTVSFEYMTASGSGYFGDNRGYVTMQPLAAFGSQDEYSVGQAVFEPMTIAGGGWETASVGIAITIEAPGIVGGLIEYSLDAEGAALAYDEILPDFALDITDVVLASDFLTTATDAPYTHEETLRGVTILSGGFLDDRLDTADVFDEPYLRHVYDITDAAAAVDAPEGYATITGGFEDDLIVTGLLLLGGSADFITVAAGSEALSAGRMTTFADDPVDASGEPEPSSALDAIDILDEATALDSIASTTASTATITDEAWARSALAAVINNATAWVMNTESTAVAWYVNWPFVDMAQSHTKTYAIGPEGLYVVGGDTDNGSPIRSRVEFDYTDFGGYDRGGEPIPNHSVSRVENVYVGMEHGAPMRLGVQVQGDARTYTYDTKRKPSTTTRNDRFTPGLGLRSRYWKLYVENTDGGDFAITDMAADVATNNRRL
jgi:hypothetical protein